MTYNPDLLRANSAAELTASEFLARFRVNDITASEYLNACADRIEQLDDELKAFKVWNREAAVHKAAELDAKRASDPAVSRRALAGVPIGVKDIFNTYDFPTGMGSPIMEHYTPGNDARVVSNMRLDGAIVMGKTVTAEFAVHHPGPTVNPWDRSRSPGTSSSGSVVAVASRMCPIALASQTAGSVIRPASYTGVLGYKPSFGLIPRTAMLKTTDTLDSVGMVARSVADLRLAFESIRVRGHNYPVSEAALNDPAHQQVAGRKWRVGVVHGPKSAFEASAPQRALETLVGRLREAGCEVFDYHMPAEFDLCHDMHERIYRRSLAYYFKMEWQSDQKLFSAEMQEMVNGGLEVTPEQYFADVELQKSLIRQFDRQAQDFDVLIGLSTADDAPVGLYGKDRPDHCLIWTSVGVPAISLPLASGSSGLPVGIQVVSRRFADYKLLDFSDKLMALAGEAPL